jgi:coenzyme F420-reducing hydrogenase gamma subunit
MGLTKHTITAPLDVAFVEGAVSTPDDLELLMRLRSRSRLLVAFGTCALWGGIAAMKNREARKGLAETVYGPAAVDLETFNPQPLHRFVKTDFAITGCPPEKGELLTTLAALLRGTFPVFPPYPVCAECRSRENPCLLMERDELCLGPLTKAGCNARCPAVGIGCEGCRGPVAEANVAEEVELLLARGFSWDEIVSRMQRFYPEWNYEHRS